MKIVNFLAKMHICYKVSFYIIQYRIAKFPFQKKMYRTIFAQKRFCSLPYYSLIMLYIIYCELLIKHGVKEMACAVAAAHSVRRISGNSAKAATNRPIGSHLKAFGSGRVPICLKSIDEDFPGFPELCYPNRIFSDVWTTMYV